jgi:hypothetical protein
MNICVVFLCSLGILKIIYYLIYIFLNKKEIDQWKRGAKTIGQVSFLNYIITLIYI